MIVARAKRRPQGPFVHVRRRPGQWRPISSTVCTLPSARATRSPWVAKVEPFVVESNEQFRARGRLPSRAGIYAKDYDEVKTLGSVTSTVHAEQQALVNFFQANQPSRCTAVFPHVLTRKGSTWPSKRGSSPCSRRPRGRGDHLLEGQGALELLAVRRRDRLGTPTTTETRRRTATRCGPSTTARSTPPPIRT